MISTGSLNTECMRATRALKKDGISCALYDLCCLKPVDKTELLGIIGKYNYIITVEEHFKRGGLGSIISEIISECGINCRLIRIGIEDIFPHAGDYAYMLKSNHLTAQYIKETIVSELK